MVQHKSYDESFNPHGPLNNSEAEEILENMDLVGRRGDWGCFRMGKAEK